MADDTLTLRLDGDVGLREFAVAIDALDGLVRALAGEEGASADAPTWRVSDLQTSSAIATVMGSGGAPGAVQRVVRRYEGVGEALRAGDLAGLESPVAISARRLSSVIDGGVTAIVFETARLDIQVSRPLAEVIEFPTPRPVAAPAPVVHDLPTAFGAVQGRVQTLSSRGGLRFTLYDRLHDKAVSCYLSEGQQPEMVDVWGRLAEVEGWVKRDARTGRPMSVRGIRRIATLPEPADHWDVVLGVAPSTHAMSAAEAVRRVRNA